MKKIYRLLILTSFLFILFCGSVFAVNGAEFTMNSPLVNNETAEVGVLNVSKLDESARNFMKDYVINSKNYIVALSGARVGATYFIKFRSSYDVRSLNYIGGLDAINVPCCVDVVCMDLLTGNPIYNTVKTINFDKFTLQGFIEYQFLIDNGYSGVIPRIWKPIKHGLKLKLKFDDVIEPVSSTPVSSEPTSSTPSSSEPTSSTPVTSESVTSTFINYDYVPFSRTAVKNFTDNIRHSVGIGTNTGWLIWFFIIGICIVLNIIRYLTR